MSIFYAIDFDRTLGNVEGQTTQLQHFVASQGLAWPEELTTRIAEAHAAGKSFDVISYIHSIYPEVAVDILRQQYMAYAATHERELVLPGAHSFIAWLDRHALPYGIVSYGESAWQEFKIEAAGFQSLPHLIVATRKKAQLFATWRHGGLFCIPPELGGGNYKTLVLIDDRLGAFKGLSKGMRGYWIAGDQTGHPPEDVMRVTSLAEIRDHEAAFLAKH